MDSKTQNDSTGNDDLLESLSSFQKLKAMPEIAILKDHLLDDEQVLELTTSSFEGRVWLVALTRFRFLFLDKGIFTRLQTKEILLDSIADSSTESGLLSGSLFLKTTAGTCHELTNIQNDDLRRISITLSTIRCSISNEEASANDQQLVPHLERLAALYADGLLSENEFFLAKKKLIDPS